MLCTSGFFKYIYRQCRYQLLWWSREETTLDFTQSFERTGGVISLACACISSHSGGTSTLPDLRCSLVLTEIFGCGARVLDQDGFSTSPGFFFSLPCAPLSEQWAIAPGWLPLKALKSGAWNTPAASLCCCHATLPLPKKKTKLKRTQDK